MLTALAVEGFDRLRAVLLHALDEAGPAAPDRLTALGRAHLDFGLAEPALFELMFRGDQLHDGDDDLRAGRAASWSPRVQRTGRSTPRTNGTVRTALLAPRMCATAGSTTPGTPRQRCCCSA